MAIKTIQSVLRIHSMFDPRSDHVSVRFETHFVHTNGIRTLITDFTKYYVHIVFVGWYIVLLLHKFY